MTAKQEKINELLDPKNLEQAPAPIHTPEDTAALFFKMNKDKLKQNLAKLSQRQLKRVIMTAAAYPLTDHEHDGASDIEKNSLYLLNEMLINKSVMLLSVEMAKAEQAFNESKQEASKGTENEQT